MPRKKNFKKPWFPFYAADFLTDTNHLTNEEIGAYIRLLAHQWIMDGLPKDDFRLCLLVSETQENFVPIWEQIGTFFVPKKDGKIRQERLEKERKKADKISKLNSNAGKKGAEARWRNDNEGMANAMANATEKPWRNDAQSQSQSHNNLDKEKQEVTVDDVIKEPAKFKNEWKSPKVLVDSETFVEFVKYVNESEKGWEQLKDVPISILNIERERIINYMKDNVGWAKKRSNWATTFSNWVGKNHNKNYKGQPIKLKKPE